MTKISVRRARWFSAACAAAACAAFTAFPVTASAATTPSFNLPSMNEAPMKAWPMIYGTEPTTERSPSARIFGIIQPGYSYDQVAGHSTVLFYRFRPGLRGKLTKNINYYFLPEFARNGATLDYLTNPSGPSSKFFHGARLLDGSVTLNQIPEVHVQIGQMLVPFAWEGVVGAGGLPWINYTDGTVNIFYKEGLSDSTINAGREMGVMAFNQFVAGKRSWDYEAGWFNGNGLSQTAANRARDFIGHLGGSYGPFGLAGGVWTGTETVAGTNLGRTKFALDARYGNYLKDSFWIWGEYQHADDEQAGAAPNLKAQSWFVSGGYRPVRWLEAVVRYSSYQPDTSVGNYVNMTSVVGTVFGSHHVRYLLEYDHRTFPGFGKRSDNRVNMEISVPFSISLM